MPVFATIGAGVNRTSPAEIIINAFRPWSGAQILTNLSLNQISSGIVYTSSTDTSLNNCLVYKNSRLTEKLNNTTFKVGSLYYYADATGWSTRVHNFNGSGDTYVTIPKEVCDFRTNDVTIELFFSPRVIPTHAYSAYRNVGEPEHCKRLMGFLSTSVSNNGVYSTPRVQGFLDWYMTSSTVNPGIEWSAWSNIITTSTPIEANKWYHFAFTRTADVQRIYVNGVLSGVIPIRYNQNLDWKASDLTRPLAVGTRAETCPYSGSTIYGMWNGWISDVRIIKGKSLYSSANFAVPLRPLTLQGHRGGNQNITGLVTLACQQELGTGYLGSAITRTQIGT
jgi:hypothetical protein